MNYEQIHFMTSSKIIRLCNIFFIFMNVDQQFISGFHFQSSYNSINNVEGIERRRKRQQQATRLSHFLETKWHVE